MKTFLFFGLATALFFQSANGAEAPAAPTLKEVGNNLFSSGTVNATINGKDHAFICTSQTLAKDLGERVSSQNEAAKNFAARLAGKTVNTAVIRHIAGLYFVSFDAYGNVGPNGPDKVGDKRTFLEVNFALDPKTLKIVDRNRRVAYAAAGTATSDRIEGNKIEINLDSVTVHSDGSMAFKGSFDGVLDSQNSKDADKPVTVKGTFDIQRATGSDVLTKALSGK